ncbi:MAG: 2-C-methyl-D-erythritol 4-phosphate cytidylyltransferase [Thermoleophilaceae bacterium]|nr:2-C-methyl-D-erythritol 4-phosphate cytidylyltransferase [Thermoleophilaceae bacterium]
MTVVGIVPAGGSGERLGAGGPKAFVALADKQLYEWSVDALLDACDHVIVAVPSESPVPSRQSPGLEFVPGGESRSESVRNALLAAPEAHIVVVHDAARPLVTSELVQACVDALEPGVDGAIAAARMTDTVKEAAPDGRVVRTLDRSSLWRIQTPQVFRADVLREALDRDITALAAATDDASLVEQMGRSVKVVEAPPDNMKVTSEADFRVAEALLRERV